MAAPPRARARSRRSRVPGAGGGPAPVTSSRGRGGPPPAPRRPGGGRPASPSPPPASPVGPPHGPTSTAAVARGSATPSDAPTLISQLPGITDPSRGHRRRQHRSPPLEESAPSDALPEIDGSPQASSPAVRDLRADRAWATLSGGHTHATGRSSAYPPASARRSRGSSSPRRASGGPGHRRARSGAEKTCPGTRSATATRMRRKRRGALSSRAGDRGFSRIKTGKTSPGDAPPLREPASTLKGPDARATGTARGAAGATAAGASTG